MKADRSLRQFLFLISAGVVVQALADPIRSLLHTGSVIRFGSAFLDAPVPAMRSWADILLIFATFLAANQINMELILRLPMPRWVWLGLGTAVVLVGAVASWWIASFPHPSSTRVIFCLALLAGTSGARKLIERIWPLATGEIPLKQLEHLQSAARASHLETGADSSR